MPIQIIVPTICVYIDACFLSPDYTPAFLPPAGNAATILPSRVSLRLGRKMLAASRFGVSKKPASDIDAEESEKVQIVELFRSPPRKTLPLVQSVSVFGVTWCTLAVGHMSRKCLVKIHHAALTTWMRMRIKVNNRSEEVFHPIQNTPKMGTYFSLNHQT